MTATQTPTVDESAAILTAKIQARESFFFVRYGDGALECLAGRLGITRDHEPYSPELADSLLTAWRSLMTRPERVLVGDWQSASFDNASAYSRYEDQYEALFDGVTPAPQRLHFESLLLMRKSAALVDFYRAVKVDKRSKLFMGPEWNAGGAKMLGAAHLTTRTSDLQGDASRLVDELLAFPFEVLIFGAGMVGNVIAAKCWERYPDRTYINIGSALDPLFHKQTRSQQLSKAEARELFKDLL